MEAIPTQQHARWHTMPQAAEQFLTSLMIISRDSYRK
jgi:hypothetical protein